MDTMMITYMKRHFGSLFVASAPVRVAVRGSIDDWSPIQSFSLESSNILRLSKATCSVSAENVGGRM